LPNLLLSAGYLLFFLAAFLNGRGRQNFLQGVSFGAALLIGMAPTLAANAINAGSPFSTTYGSADAVSPELNLDILRQYLGDPQFLLLLIAAAWSGLLWHFNARSGTRQLALLVAVNLVVNLAFFITHPIFTPYYTIPIAMISLWTLLFATVLRDRDKGADNRPSRQPSSA